MPVLLRDILQTFRRWKTILSILIHLSSFAILLLNRSSYLKRAVRDYVLSQFLTVYTVHNPVHVEHLLFYLMLTSPNNRAQLEGHGEWKLQMKVDNDKLQNRAPWSCIRSQNSSTLYLIPSLIPIQWGFGTLYSITLETRDVGPFIESGDKIIIWVLGRNSIVPVHIIEESARSYQSLRPDCLEINYPKSKRDRSSYNYPWSPPSFQSIRPMESLDLPEAVKDVVADIQLFLDPATKKNYEKKGIMYKKNYLFNGPPGTGKSSLVLALATQFQFKIYSLNVSDQEISDDELMDLAKTIETGSILVLEDIDRAPSLQQKISNSEKVRWSGVTLLGMLNLLDGMAITAGRVLIMTINEKKSLNTALLRPGRVDREYHFPFLDALLGEQMFVRMYKDFMLLEDLRVRFARIYSHFADHKISPASFQQYLQIRDPDAAIKDICELV